MIFAVADPGMVRLRHGRILGSRDCFDVPSHTPYDFEARVENKLHIVI